MPRQIIYASTATTPQQAGDLASLLDQARTHNTAQGITGALVYFEGAFLQVLEGEAERVQGLMHRIVRDLRHEKVLVLQDLDLPAPMFGPWTMAYVGATAQQVAAWAGLPAREPAPDLLDALRTELREHQDRAALLAQRILAQLVADTSTPPD